MLWCLLVWVCYEIPARPLKPYDRYDYALHKARMEAQAKADAEQEARIQAMKSRHEEATRELEQMQWEIQLLKEQELERTREKVRRQMRYGY